MLQTPHVDHLCAILETSAQTTSAACVQADSTPGSRDAEEFIEVHRVGVPELRHLLTHADMLLPTMTTSYMALERLAQMGYL